MSYALNISSDIQNDMLYTELVNKSKEKLKVDYIFSMTKKESELVLIESNLG